MLTEDTARNIGIHSYFPNVRRVFVEILRALDTHYGRPLMMTCTQNMNKVINVLLNIIDTEFLVIDILIFMIYYISIMVSVCF